MGRYTAIKGVLGRFGDVVVESLILKIIPVDVGEEYFRVKTEYPTFPFNKFSDLGDTFS